MIIDKLLQVSDAQAVTATAASTDVIDAGHAGRDIGAGEQLFAVFTVSEAAAAAGAATVVFAVQDSANNSDFVSVVATAPIGKADLVVGKHIVLPLPPGMRRYVRAHFTVATGPLTAGKFSAQIVRDYQHAEIYPSALS